VTRVWLRGFAPLLALLLVTSCKRTPKCEGELERDDVYRLQELTRDGEYPCPGHLKPTISVRRDGVELNGLRVASEAQLPTGSVRKIQGLFDALKQNRETWKQVNPGSMFDARPNITIDGGCDFATGAGALMTAAFAGYPSSLVSSGGVLFDLHYEVPGPPMPDEEPPRKPRQELLIVRSPAGGYTVAVREGATVIHYSGKKPLAFDAVPGWVAQHCASTGKDPCVNVLVLNVPGEFALTATLIRSILDGPGFKKFVPTVRFVTPS
jgi:hypothetical protein